MSGATDSGMVKTMGVVMAALAVIAIVCVIAARSLSDGDGQMTDPIMRAALMQRIEPTAAVRTSMDDLPAAAPAAEMAAVGQIKSGEELVQGACAACHVGAAAAAVGAPALGDDAAWATRAEAGLDALVASVINGKGSMPARGGSTYSDEEIRKAVEHMAGLEVSEADIPKEQAGEESAEAVVEAEAETTAETIAETTAEAGETATAVAAVVGVAPEGLTDSVKGTVDGVCAGCHLAGVANAPKTGDKEAWQIRADKGMDALTSSVINGLGVMPPRGGSALSDEEVPMAIQYLMSK